MKELTIITHLGLGDLILQSGMAVHLAQQYDKVYFPCRRRDYNSVRSFFLLQPKIEVVPLDTDSTTPQQYGVKQGSDILILGFGSPLGWDPAISFSENFYQQAGVDYSVRWDECPIQEVVDAFYDAHTMCGYGYFIHQDRERGYVIRHHGKAAEEDIYATPSPSSILAYSSTLKYAKEIHVIDSAFLHLAESIETRGELYLHEYARQSPYPGSKCPTRKKWTVLT